MDALLDGRQVVAVSRLGQGHAGLVVARLLMQAGLPSDAAIEMVRRTCGDHVLSSTQGEMVGTFEQLDRGSHK
ncbi:hypothetical protein GCM10008955_13030 [Deinococcus malanensis]|uniref:Tyrosine specific protein phosphatases domain-containing protein n=1 Tax=Deinococcus malanensis TaxID=1706855 RepID=A0ABQ2EQ40_9DEIO|nr:hypothetical protein GCM10008955_13030 [Deinococcus malanensis]